MRLVHHHRHVDLDKSFLGKEEASKHPPHLSSFCAMRESASCWSPAIQKFSDDMGLRCRYPSRQNALSQRWCQASVCQLLTIVEPTVAHSLQRASCLGVLPKMVANWSCLCQNCLSFDVHLASSIPNFSSVPKNCTRELFSRINQPPRRRPLSLTYIVGVLVLLLK